MKKIGAGLIGNPQRLWMASAHVPALQALESYEIAAVCTSRQASADEAARALAIPHAYADAAALARDPSVDLVVVSAKVPSHRDAVTAAIDAGKAIFCEWPLGRDTAEAIEMRDAAARRGVVNAIGLQSRHSPALNYAKDLIAQGYVGRAISTTLFSSNPTRGATVPADKAWTADARGGLSTLTVSGGHCMDAIGYILGGVRDVSATLAVAYPEQTVVETGEIVKKDAPDQVILGGTLQSGGVYSVHIQYGTFDATGLLFEINGTDGDLIVESAQASGIQMAELTLRGRRREDGAERGRPLPELRVPASYRYVPDAVAPGPPLNVAQAYAKLAQHIGASQAATPDFSDAVRLHRLIDAIRTAAASGVRQTI